MLGLTMQGLEYSTPIRLVIMAADDLTPCAPRSSAAMALTMEDKYMCVLELHEEESISPYDVTH